MTLVLKIEVEVNRVGMSGTLAYEIRGLKEDGPNVYHAAYEIGKPRISYASVPLIPILFTSNSIFSHGILTLRNCKNARS